MIYQKVPSTLFYSDFKKVANWISIMNRQNLDPKENIISLDNYYELGLIHHFRQKNSSENQ